MIETNDLTNKVVLITGSSRGLGKYYAIQMAKLGASVAIHDVNSKASSEFGESNSGENVAEEIKKLGQYSDFFAADLTFPDQVESLVDSVIKKFGKIDILVNNAGGDIGFNSPRPNPNDAIDIKVEDIKSVVDRNLLNIMYMCKFVGNHMKKRNSGKIINIGSGSGHMTTTEGIIYASSKSAISHYTLCLGEQLRPYNVNVNCLAPSPTYTERFKATRTIKEQNNLSKLQKIATPEDMASIVLFLASSQSDYLTSETIVSR